MVSFPSVRKILNSRNTQGYTSPTVSLNSAIYRYGHAFMYDTDIVMEYLARAGFSHASVTTRTNAPLQEYLDPEREAESEYVFASKCHS